MEYVALAMVIFMQSFWIITCLVVVYIFIRRCRTIRDRRSLSVVSVPAFSITSITPPITRSYFDSNSASHNITPTTERSSCNDFGYGVQHAKLRQGGMKDELELDVISSQNRFRHPSAPQSTRRLSTVSMPAFNTTSMTTAVPRSQLKPDTPSHPITLAKEIKLNDLEYGPKLETSQEGAMEERLELDMISTENRSNHLAVPNNG